MTQYKTERQWWNILSRNDVESASLKGLLDGNRHSIGEHLKKFGGLKNHVATVAN